MASFVLIFDLYVQHLPEILNTDLIRIQTLIAGVESIHVDH